MKLAPIFVFASKALSQALFEPVTKLYFGAWVDSNNSPVTGKPQDSPASFNSRIGQKSAFFQLAYNFPLNFNDPPPTFLIDETNTNAFLYLTIYPSKVDGVSDVDIQDVVKQIAGFTSKGRRVFLRWAPEMNGNWFAYGQRPSDYIRLWMRVREAINRNTLAQGKVAMIWAPSIAFGYPFLGGQFARNGTNYPDFKLLDTNNDGVYDAKDDPYRPFYPGDDNVDWVGLSVYYFGRTYPWINNETPLPDHFKNVITGTNGYGGFDFYSVYSSPQGAGKPFFVTETGASFHKSFLANSTAVLVPGDGELAIKQTFWKEFLTSPDAQKVFPKIKAVCLFEFEKAEELTMRNFAVTTSPAIFPAFKADFDANLNSYIFADDNTPGAPVFPGSSQRSDALVNSVSLSILLASIILSI